MTVGSVLGLLLMAVVLTAPMWVKRLRPGAEHANVRVLGRTALSRSAVVAVVEIGDRRLLVGAAEQGVSVLTELDPHTAADTPLDGAAPADVDLTALTHEGEGRTDAALPTSAAQLLAGTSPTAGPRIGPLDRLRAMTVRTTPPPGRPIRVPLRR